MKAEERDGSDIDPGAPMCAPFLSAGMMGEAKIARPVLRFETFKSSEEFAVWQRTRSVQVVSAVPVVVVTTSESFGFGGQTGYCYGVFVTYEGR